MAVAVDLVELQKNDVAAGVPVDCAMQCYEPTDIELYYGTSRTKAVYSTDYTVDLAIDFADFTLTPTASLITKITNLGEGNITFVVRNPPPTTDFTENDGFLRAKIAFAIDRVYMAMQYAKWAATSLSTFVAAAAASAASAASAATASAASATASAGSATSAANSYDTFDDRWLGEKAADPTLDNDGNALIVGATYFNTVDNLFKVWNGSAFIYTYLPAGAYLLLAGGTMTGLLNTIASASGGAGFRLPHGAAPTSPVNGDVWTTTVAFFARINGVTQTLLTLAGGIMTGIIETLASSTAGAGLRIPHGAAPTSPTNGDVWTTSAAGLFARINGVTLNLQSKFTTLAGYGITDGAAKTQQAETIAGVIAGNLSDKSYTLVLKVPHGGVITSATTKSLSGTCTMTFKINTTVLGGTANSVSSSEQSQAHSSANTFSADDDIVVTISANASCVDASFTLKYTRTLE